MSDDVSPVRVMPDVADEELTSLARTLKTARRLIPEGHIVTGLNNFANDPPEEWEVPDVRPLCRRLAGLGFTAALDLLAGLPDAPAAVRVGHGVAEAWVIGEGQPRRRTDLTPDLVDQLVLLRVFYAGEDGRAIRSVDPCPADGPVPTPPEPPPRTT